jgi:hypothetical protein
MICKQAGRKPPQGLIPAPTASGETFVLPRGSGALSQIPLAVVLIAGSTTADTAAMITVEQHLLESLPNV